MLSAGIKYDSDKPRWALVPFDAMTEVVRVITFGAEKYEANNWRRVDNGKERYLSAVFRHLAAHCEGQMCDPETGLMHLAHAGCGILFLLHYHLRERCHVNKASQHRETGEASRVYNPIEADRDDNQCG